MQITKRFDEMVDWLTSNYAYGHLDEIPDSFLLAILSDLRLSFAFSSMCYQASRTQSDNIEELLVTHSVTARELIVTHCRVRFWLIVERLHRMGRVKLDSDLLLKELASPKHTARVLTLEGQPLKGQVVETETGIINIVGEEINLCQK